MNLNATPLCIILIICEPILCCLNTCTNNKIDNLTATECSELYFEANEKATKLGQVKLTLKESCLRVSPEAKSWNDAFLRVLHNNGQFCSKLQASDFCFTLDNSTFLLEYKIEKLPEISYRKLLFKSPENDPIFLYIDQTDTSRLILRAQKLKASNASLYRVEAYKEKNGNVALQDVQLFSPNEDILYELVTYNDVGNYYFVVSSVGGPTMKLTTPKVFIGRKSTRVVIGIVGASFILPFVLFIFHVLTKKYPDDSKKEKLVVVYKSFTKKHNEVASTLAALLGSTLPKREIVLIDVAKPNKKIPCFDSLILSSQIVFVAQPKHDLSPCILNKPLFHNCYVVVFDYCSSNFEGNTTFKFFQDFDDFCNVLHIEQYDLELFDVLLTKTDDAKNETEEALTETSVPQIVITSDAEPHEQESLIANK